MKYPVDTQWDLGTVDLNAKFREPFNEENLCHICTESVEINIKEDKP